MNYQTLHFDEIDSTSSYLKRNFAAVADFTFVSADYQSEGRGRSNRAWFSSKGINLMFSFVLKDKGMIARFMDLSLASSYVLAKVIEKKFPTLKPQIKWPNDVYLDGKKMCGILLESHMENNEIDGLIVGIGVNVNQTEFPSELIYPVTSLKKELGKDVDILDFQKDFYQAIYDRFNQIKDGDKSHLEYARTHNYLKDREVMATIKGEKTLVKVLDINPDCSLKVAVNGKEMNLISGEITFH